MQRIFLIFCLGAALIPGMTACSSKSYYGGATEPGVIRTVDHNPVSLLNYKQARIYSAQGRYELAREQYLLAYAAAEGDPVLRSTLAQELKAVDMMLRTMR